MTREELDFIGSMNMCDEISNEAYKKIVCHCEEQEPCKDCISRQAVLELAEWFDLNLQHFSVANLIDEVENMPSVKPQEPKTGYISIDDVMSVFDDFMCGEVDEDGTDTFLEMLKDKAEQYPQEPKTEKVIKMREATPEERESVDEYIKSISEPTGVNFWEEQEHILDKIRAEIDSHCSDNRDRNDGLYIAMKIIDKYRQEG